MTLFVLLICYLIGSFPTAYLLVMAMRRTDIRRLGDGNMGGQNTFRQVGALAGVAVAATDMLKGALVIFIAREAGLNLNWVLLAGLAGLAGHNWPLFLGFKGGRGEAITIGILVSLIPLPMLIALGLSGVTLAITHSVTKASAPLFISLPLLCWAFGAPFLLVIYGMALPCVVALTTYWRVRQPRIMRTG